MQQSRMLQDRMETLIDVALANGFERLALRDKVELFLCFAAFSSPETTSFTLPEPDPADVFSMSRRQLEELGLDEAAAFLVEFFPELSSRIGRSEERRAAKAEEKERSEAQKKRLEDYVSDLLAGAVSEQLIFLFFDDDGHIAKTLTYPDGTLGNITVAMSEVLSAAVGLSSDFVLMAHNHPSGACYPSGTDCESTLALYDHLRKSGITLIDHYIVTSSSVCSLRSVFDFTSSDRKELLIQLTRLKNAKDEKLIQPEKG